MANFLPLTKKQGQKSVMCGIPECNIANEFEGQRDLSVWLYSGHVKAGLDEIGQTQAI